MVGRNIFLMFTRWSLALVVCGMAVHGFSQTTQAPKATPVPGPEHEVTTSVGEQPADQRTSGALAGQWLIERSGGSGSPGQA